MAAVEAAWVTVPEPLATVLRAPILLTDAQPIHLPLSMLDTLTTFKIFWPRAELTGRVAVTCIRFSNLASSPAEPGRADSDTPSILVCGFIAFQAVED
jgi:hypothetical protein